MKKNQGYFLVFVLVFAAVAVTVISGLVTFTNANILAGRRAIVSEQAFQLAEAGIEYYRWHLAHNGTDFSDGGGAFPHPHNFYDKSGNLLGVFNLTITPPGAGSSVEIQSQGIPASNPSLKRTIISRLRAGLGVSFRYGIQSGVGGFILGNNAEIDGNVYSNGNIQGGNGSSITGEAYAVGRITNVNTGASHPGVVPIEMPLTDVEINQWKSEAATTTFIGNKNLSGTNNSLGPIKIQGNLTLSGNASLKVTGTIWVTGDISFGNDASISLSPVYASGSGVIVTDGMISLGNNAEIDGSGTSGSALMLLTTSSASSAVSLGNGAVAMILYAPSGTINVGNNANLKVISAKTISLGNNVGLSYEQGFIDIAFTNGPSGGWHTFSWQEVAL